MRAIPTITGSALFLLGTIGCFCRLGGNPLSLLMLEIMAGITLAALGSAIMTFGFRNVWNGLTAIRFLFITPSQKISVSDSIAVLQFLNISVYVVGALLFIFCAIITLTTICGPLDKVAQHIANATCSLTYPIFLSEGLLRPLRTRLECLNK